MFTNKKYFLLCRKEIPQSRKGAKRNFFCIFYIAIKSFFEIQILNTKSPRKIEGL
jgi:hypothetical protein